MNCTMISFRKSIKCYFCFILLSIMCVKLPNQARASGVFELELIDFHRLDDSADGQSSGNNLRAPISGANVSSQSWRPPVQIVICLKEAFTSQLDGPCTFGNASITLSSQQQQQHQITPQRHHTAMPTTNTPLSAESTSGASLDEQQSKSKASKKTTDQQQQQQQVLFSQSGTMRNNSNDNNNHQNATMPSIVRRSSPIEQQQQGSQHNHQQQASLLTNVVRIQFTFRWTKSFTIILSAEQIGAARQINTARTGTTDTNQNDNEPPLSPPSRSVIIDRHVTTENEVLPSLEINSIRQPWTSRHQRSLRSSIIYRFRVYCALNYFGDGCMTFCRPRNDQFGHYNCSMSGQKICHDGWTGPDCDKAKCRSGCNQQHGYCDKPDTCQCRPGWTGPRCDECMTYPGCQNGYCLSPWQCNCQPNWGGVLCDQDLNYCGSHDPCRNNGTCQNVAPGRYKCLCVDGFAGVNCETSLTSLQQQPATNLPGSLSSSQLSAGCALNPCLNGGTCYAFDMPNATLPNKINSKLQNNQTGLDKDLSILAEILQAPEYESQSSAGLMYRCQCPPGWSGDYCQWAESLAVPSSDLLLDVSSGSINSTSEHVQVPSVTNAFSTIDTQTRNADENQTQKIWTETEMDQTNTMNTITLEIANDELTTVASNVARQQQSHLEMRHLISGVVLASAVGVFIAALMLTWCCLVAIERNRLSFIQMNIIRQSSPDEQEQIADSGTSFGSTLRRMQTKIRDSFRVRSHSRGRQIKPETRLSIDNVLRPPPSYEESNYCETYSNISNHQPCSSGTHSKYLSIASQNLSLYKPGSTIVGNPELTTDLTTRSIFLSQVKGLT